MVVYGSQYFGKRDTMSCKIVLLERKYKPHLVLWGMYKMVDISPFPQRDHFLRFPVCYTVCQTPLEEGFYSVSKTFLFL